MSRYYILKDREVIPTDDVREWGRFFNDSEARVIGNDKVGEATVSTVFLGLDHGFGHAGPPVLFETMVFDLPGDERQVRYTTIEEAEEGHRGVVESLREDHRQPKRGHP